MKSLRVAENTYIKNATNITTDPKGALGVVNGQPSGKKTVRKLPGFSSQNNVTKGKLNEANDFYANLNTQMVSLS